jgi:hypothetical protein
MSRKLTTPSSLDDVPNGRLILIAIVAMLVGSAGMIVSHVALSGEPPRQGDPTGQAIRR